MNNKARIRAILIWVALAAFVAVPIAVAAKSPLIAWREPAYIVAGLAGVVALALLLIQPVLAGGYLPGLPVRRGRRLHQWMGGLLVAAVVIHVAGLWITSPPDVIDALFFVSPTPFSVWGVLAMWAVFASALLALLRWPLRLRPKTWRLVHSGFAIVIVCGSVVHAMLIYGTMGLVSKIMLCTLVVAALTKTLFDLRTWALLPRR